MNTQEQSLPNLVVSKDEASEKIQARIAKGKELEVLPIRSERDLEEAQAAYFKWSNYNSRLLSGLFDNLSIAKEYSSDLCFSVSGLTLEQEIRHYRRGVTNKIHRLESFLEQILDEVIPERIPDSPTISSPEQTVANGDEVFIVHGHDTAAKSEVARFVEKLGLKVIILDEQPGGGKTIIEKFEASASNAGFAIILLTYDDVGAAKDEQDNLKPRARQNVIFEMGYFVKALDRGRVCAMSTDEVEIPSDLAGVEYIRLDADGGWKSKLARELKAAGISIDTSKLV